MADIGNCFFSLMGEVTDKREHDIMDSEERIQYKLTPEQLKYAHTIRQLTDSFRRRASKILNQHNTIDRKIHDTIKNLSKDRSIFITKADKGRSIVILDRADYIQKIESIINDNTNFKIFQKDPTLTNEDKLIRKLRELKANGFITDKEYLFCYPTSSQPSRLYGLPKVHKEGLPIRPILSACGTFNYKLAQMLAKRLQHLRKSVFLIDNSFTFVDQLHSLDIKMNLHRIVSFDITSLFTNIPLTDTIEIILRKLYKDHCSCPASKEEGSITNKCSTCTNKDNMRWLITTATARTHFHFNGKIYQQHNGVSMGSPLGPLLADIFLLHLEEHLMDELHANGLVYYKRYVDDIFAIIKEGTNINRLMEILNSFHKSIQFTYELENNGSLPFLDISVQRLPQHERSWFSTSVYRKPTFTGLLLNWKSFVPHEYKKRTIASMVYRAIRISSDYSIMHKEFLFIRQLAVSNGYPLSFVQGIIKNTLERQLYKLRLNRYIMKRKLTRRQ